MANDAGQGSVREHATRRTIVFPPWSDTAFRIALVGFALTPLVVIGAPMIWVRTPFHEKREFAVDQPVQFDHRHHAGDDGIDCLYCHGDALRGAHAGVPATEVCMGCHAQVWPDSLALEPVRRSMWSGAPLRWNRVHRLPDYVYFDHSIHLAKGVGCSTCHGRVDRMAVEYQVAPLTMQWCLDCHRDPRPNLRPLDQLTSMTWRPHDDATLAPDVHPGTHCTTCHR